MSARDYIKLKTRMTEKQISQQDLSKVCNMTETTFSLKINSKGVFKQSEIQAIVELLEIPKNEIGAYFFTLIV